MLSAAASRCRQRPRRPLPLPGRGCGAAAARGRRGGAAGWTRGAAAPAAAVSNVTPAPPSRSEWERRARGYGRWRRGGPRASLAPRGLWRPREAFREALREQRTVPPHSPRRRAVELAACVVSSRDGDVAVVLRLELDLAVASSTMRDPRPHGLFPSAPGWTHREIPKSTCRVAFEAGL